MTKDQANQAALDAALAEARFAVARPSDDLMARVLADANEAAIGFEREVAAPPAPRRVRRYWIAWLAGPAARPIAACALSAAVGLWLGVSAPANVARSAGDVFALAGMETVASASFEVAMNDEDEF